MRDVVETLVIAILLVILVVYLFLQDWRATLIPMLAVLFRSSARLRCSRYSDSPSTHCQCWGLVLAIGLVVDDAIVVVEGVQRHIEEGLAPKDAALKAMKELSGPVVGIALVLASVFVPTAFIPGITGRLYQQFAMTIAISVMLSAFNALTLSQRSRVCCCGQNQRKELTSAADLSGNSLTSSIAIGNAVRMVLSAGLTR